ncbi:MAG: hypothetical protein U9Q31_02285, partial [Chloroflexota bacterium]|nr:hypothetical protein [Chloroflexota bacterium]
VDSRKDLGFLNRAGVCHLYSHFDGAFAGSQFVYLSGKALIDPWEGRVDDPVENLGLRSFRVSVDGGPKVLAVGLWGVFVSSTVWRCFVGSCGSCSRVSKSGVDDGAGVIGSVIIVVIIVVIIEIVIQIVVLSGGVFLVQLFYIYVFQRGRGRGSGRLFSATHASRHPHKHQGENHVQDGKG